MEYKGMPYKAIRSTCRDCTQRTPGCHDNCETYQEALGEWVEHKRKARHNKFHAKLIDSYCVESCIRKKR